MRIIRLIVDWMVKKLTRNAPRWRFTRFDGVVNHLACICCARCKNYFWFQHPEIEIPLICPFCGVKHDGVHLLTNEEIRKHL